jgi:hypothetical protein
MTLEQSEGYLMGLEDVKKIIENKIHECEYVIAEAYLELQRLACPDCCS